MRLPQCEGVSWRGGQYVTTDGRAGHAGLTASAVCSVTENPSSRFVEMFPELRQHCAAMASARFADTVRVHTRKALARGARPLIDARHFVVDRAGTAYLMPQVLIDVDHTMRVMMRGDVRTHRRYHESVVKENPETISVEQAELPVPCFPEAPSNPCFAETVNVGLKNPVHVDTEAKGNLSFSSRDLCRRAIHAVSSPSQLPRIEAACVQCGSTAWVCSPPSSLSPSRYLVCRVIRFDGRATNNNPTGIFPIASIR